MRQIECWPMEIDRHWNSLLNSTLEPLLAQDHRVGQLNMWILRVCWI